MRLHPIKFVNHAADHPEDPVLRVRPALPEDERALTTGLAASLGLPPATRLGALLEGVEGRMVRVEGVSADEPNFKVSSLLHGGAGLDADAVLCFGDLTDLWLMTMRDLDCYFDSIWYSGPDDLLILARQGTWAVEVLHTGEVRSWKA